MPTPRKVNDGLKRDADRFADATRRLRTGLLRRRAVVVLLAVVGMIATTLSLPISTAAYTALTSTDAAFDAAACFFRASVQSGTVVSTTDGTTGVTINPVDPTRAFLMFTSRHDSNRPVGTEIGGRLVSSTTIAFDRATDESSPVPMTIEWSVIDYPCGVQVQRGSVFQTAATVDWPINPVASVGQAFVLWSKTPYRLDVAWDANDPLVGELTAVDNLQFRADALNVNHVIWWQVVEFIDPSMIAVQHGTSPALAGSLASTTATLATPVDPARAFVLVGGRSTGPGADIASGLVRGHLTDPTTLALDRDATNYDVTEVVWQVVELRDGSTVQSGAAVFPVGTATVVVAVNTVDPARSTAFAAIQTGGGQNAGSTTYVADDVIGVAATGMRLSSPTQLTLTRDNTTGDAMIQWFVVSWGLQ